MPRLLPVSIVIGLPLLFEAVAFGAAAPDQGPTPAAPTATDANTQQEPLQEVVVTGMRASLEKSLDDKKYSSVIQDSIDAEEMGRFPDSDVADSLEHLPGITITRTTGGDGEKVSVRGFGPQYNIVTLNNRLLATDDPIAATIAFKRVAVRNHLGCRRAENRPGLCVGRQYRRYSKPAYGEPLRQPGDAWWRACRG